jgi:hypothetical protein
MLFINEYINKHYFISHNKYFHEHGILSIANNGRVLDPYTV